MKDCKVSIIIPIYNQEKNIEKCINCIKKQTMKFTYIEILLINDGSNDCSDSICKKMEKKYQNIRYFSQINKGVSSARNVGIREAKGKYIFYLDADDELAEDTIKQVTEYFDSVYDIVDMVTYKIETIYNGEKIPPHFRYLYMKESGVYDLKELPYIGQTTMNIVVKNRFSQNIKFNEKQTFSEDQKYCCDILAEKLKIGFCETGKYIYHRSNSSASGRLAGACYIFEQCMSMFEFIFERYDRVPLAFQGLYVNDVYWKLINNILLPHHYKKNEYEIALYRIKKLLKRCDDFVILNHPGIDFFEKYYLLHLKENHRILPKARDKRFELYDGKTLVVREHSMEIVVTKLIYQNGRVLLEGFIKSVFLQFYERNPMLCVIENDGEIVRKLKLSDSAHNYYLSHEKTQNFRSFRYTCDPNRTKQIKFEVEIDSRWYPTHYYFMPLVSLSHVKGYNTCRKCDLDITLTKDQSILFHRSKNTELNKEIWLYYDCVGVKCDNGLLQFQHDIQKKDNVERYYVVTDNTQLQKDMVTSVKFGSEKHILLLQKCTKIITAYIEESNLIPSDIVNVEEFALRFSAEVVYLQHGVLHICMPWKYSREKLLADRIVVSTKEEANLYIQNGYDDEQLIKTGMPRFESLKRCPSKRKILYAPSWRLYLVGQYKNQAWEDLGEKFENSKFLNKVNSFLNSKSLENFLNKYNYTLDIKLHPIFQMYEKHFVWTSKRISINKGESEDGEYDLLITDYSSYAYNFRYLSIPVIYFFPDIEEFKCGMNGYRQLNYPESFWEEVAVDEEELVNKLYNAIVKHSIKMPKATFYECDDILETIYNRIIQRSC